MPHFIMLTRFESGLARSPQSFKTLEKKAMDKVRSNCPGVEWIQSYAVLGPCDYLDIFTAPNTDVATQVAALVQTFGRAHTEVWAATEWRHFKKLMQELPMTEGVD